MTTFDLDEAKLAVSLTAILGEAIKRPSPYPPGDTREICAFAAERLEKAGYDTRSTGKVEHCVNVAARLGQGRPSLVFNAHIDTVGVGKREDWQTDPYAAVVKDGQVFGLGAGNCKGSAAVHLWLAEEIARRGGPRSGEVVFTFVGDEENLGPLGTAYLREVGLVRPDYLILGAPTDNQLIIAERGVMWVRLTTRGRAAHAGDTASGDNAVERMIRLINALQDKLAPGLASRADGEMLSTLNLGQFHGGTNTNVVPSECMVEIDRRLLPSETVSSAFREIEEIVAAAGEPADSIDMELLTGTDGFKAPMDGVAVAALRSAVEARTGEVARFVTAIGASDGRHFANDGIEIINFGPGAGAKGHAANESVPVDQLVDAALIQLAVVDSILGLG